MEIKTILQSIAHYYSATRQVGHTTLMKEGLENTENPALVCLHAHDYAQHFDDSPMKYYECVALNELHPKLLGQNKPLVFDNEAIRQLCLMSLEKIVQLENKLKDNEDFFDDLRHTMRSYNIMD